MYLFLIYIFGSFQSIIGTKTFINGKYHHNGLHIRNLQNYTPIAQK